MSQLNPKLLARQSKEIQRLVNYADALVRSGSQVEDRYWQGLAGQLLDKLYAGRRNTSVEQTLELLGSQQQNQHYEIVMELAEAHAESLRIEHQGVLYDALLFSAPLTAWTRYQLPQGVLTETQRQELDACLRNTILAEGVLCALVPDLVNYDEMPQTYQQAYEWTHTLAAKALGRSQENVRPLAPRRPIRCWPTPASWWAWRSRPWASPCSAGSSMAKAPMPPICTASNNGCSNARPSWDRCSPAARSSTWRPTPIM